MIAMSMKKENVKRGHASHNGVVTVISLDSKNVSMLKFCLTSVDQCQAKTNDPKYHKWKAARNGKVNHTGSANSMETVGAVWIFERSLATRGLICKDMLGDGDSATYNAIVENKPYGEDCIPNKLECIGHVQKRVGSRLRKLKSTNKGLKLDDGKGLAGKGRLTDSKIDVLQNYYWISYSRKSGRCH